MQRWSAGASTHAVRGMPQSMMGDATYSKAKFCVSPSALGSVELGTNFQAEHSHVPKLASARYNREKIICSRPFHDATLAHSRQLTCEEESSSGHPIDTRFSAHAVCVRALH
jgi:hypothetical protein